MAWAVVEWGRDWVKDAKFFDDDDRIDAEFEAELRAVGLLVPNAIFVGRERTIGDGIDLDKWTLSVPDDNGNYREQYVAVWHVADNLPQRTACRLCGRTADIEYFRFLRKQGKHLMAGYYRPRLTEDELYSLPQGESEVCIDRQGCQRRQEQRRRENQQ